MGCVSTNLEACRMGARLSQVETSPRKHYGFESNSSTRAQMFRKEHGRHQCMLHMVEMPLTQCLHPIETTEMKGMASKI